jgi:hypothetical protein
MLPHIGTVYFAAELLPRPENLPSLGGQADLGRDRASCSAPSIPRRQNLAKACEWTYPSRAARRDLRTCNTITIDEYWGCDVSPSSG